MFGSFTTAAWHAARSLRRRPAMTALIVLILAAGIAASTTIFSVVDAVLLRPMPYEAPEDLVVGWQSRPGAGLFNPSMSKQEMVDLRAGTQAFESITGFGYGSMNINVDDVAVPMWTTYVDSALLDTLRVQPQLGRAFLPTEHTPGNDRVVILNGRVWRLRFDAEPEVLGREIILDGEAYTVVGVMPDSFQVPVDTKWPGRTSLILPLLEPDPADDRENRLAYFVGRLRPGVDFDQAQREVDAVTQEYVARYPDAYPEADEWRMRLRSVHDEVVGTLRPALVLLLVAVGLILVAACANVANLLLAQSAGRRYEMAVRKALGASRRRVLTQQLAESLFVGGIGGAAGLGLAYLALESVTGWLPSSLPRLDEVALDGRVLLFAIAVSVATSLLFGIVPALRAAAADDAEALRTGRGGIAGDSQRRGRMVVAAEVAVASVVLLGTGTVVGEFWQLLATDPGLEVDRLLAVSYSLDSSHGDPDEFAATHQATADELAALPGVENAGMVSNSPFWTTGGARQVDLEDRPDDSVRLVAMMAGPGYFETAGIPLLEGRAFEVTDDDRGTPVALLNQQAANRVFPGESAVGKRLRLDAIARTGADGRPEQPTESPWVMVVGIVGNTLHNGVDSPPQDEFYVPYAQGRSSGWGTMSWSNTMLRVAGPPSAVAASARGLVEAKFPGLPVRVFTVQQRFDMSLSRPRFAAQMMGIFGLLAAALAAFGIQSVIAYSVVQRRRETGIRMAIGAPRERVVREVINEWMTAVAIGLAAGTAAAMGLAAIARSQLYELGGFDPVASAVVGAGLLLVAVGACWLPARRAARIDPIEVIRTD
ncbi:MAG: FtsX-like permease family protein [Acidobacteria bacterium]|nr:FtsX-like permease family protein [Acidobacteriota bacterium]